MQADQSTVVKTVLWSVIVSALVLLVAGCFAVSSINSNLKSIDVEVDETAIASAILAGIEMPEFPEFDELWEGVYSEEIGELEDYAFIVSINQFFEDNPWPGEIPFFELDRKNVKVIDGIFEDLEESVPRISFEETDELFEFLEDEYEDVTDVQFIREYENDREINIINLGLDDEDNREVELSGVIKVLVYYDDGYEHDTDKVYINSVVTSDDGDLEAEVTYSL